MKRKFSLILPMRPMSSEPTLGELLILDKLRKAQFDIIVEFLKESKANFKCVPNNIGDEDEVLVHYIISTEENISDQTLQTIFDVVYFGGFIVNVIEDPRWKSTIEAHREKTKEKPTN